MYSMNVGDKPSSVTSSLALTKVKNRKHSQTETTAALTHNVQQNGKDQLQYLLLNESFKTCFVTVDQNRPVKVPKCSATILL